MAQTLDDWPEQAANSDAGGHTQVGKHNTSEGNVAVGEESHRSGGDSWPEPDETTQHNHMMKNNNDANESAYAQSAYWQAASTDADNKNALSSPSQAQVAAGVPNPHDYFQQAYQSPYPQASVPGGQADVVSREVECPPSVVGRVIGKGGEVIRAIQTVTGVRVYLNQDLPPDQNRIVSLSGHAAGVDRAEQMVHDVMEGGPRGASSVLAQAAGPSSSSLECPKQSVGRVIGRGGATIKALQTVSGARIQIDQQAEPCVVTINGQDANVKQAVQLVEQVLSGAPVDQLEHQAQLIQCGHAPPPVAYDYMQAYPMEAYNPYAAPPGMPSYPSPQMYGHGRGPSYPPYSHEQPAYAQADTNAYGSAYGTAYGAASYGYGPYGTGVEQGNPMAQMQHGHHAPQAQSGHGGVHAHGQQGGGQMAQTGGASVQSSQQWSSALDPNTGRTYYYHVPTGYAQWEKPAELA